MTQVCVFGFCHIYFFLYFHFIYVFGIYRRISNICLLECKRGARETRWLGALLEETRGSRGYRCEPARTSRASDRRCDGREDGQHSDWDADVYSGRIPEDASSSATGCGSSAVLRGAPSSPR